MWITVQYVDWFFVLCLLLFMLKLLVLGFFIIRFMFVFLFV